MFVDGAIMEDKSIHHSQHLDLIYSQSGTLYDLIPNDFLPSNDGSQSKLRPHVDSVVSFEYCWPYGWESWSNHHF